MSIRQSWTRGEPWPPAVQVAASVALGVVVVVMGVLRVGHDLPMAVALMTMGVASLSHAVMQVWRGRGAGADGAAVEAGDRRSDRDLEPDELPRASSGRALVLSR
ncbi:hypothetical protein [Cellulomonas wangsupingiae]|uniref:hypothetical protein n=1 Tax=Cellulomonas wangsupingiae TaxID=2968085 RepID=UPI001D0EC2CA|nr:hypothetical protein [Cellulomonas wangsupingiae]MCM0639291.1 hypothetical protein [Cellulomonas wangsupingiae]